MMRFVIFLFAIFPALAAAQGIMLAAREDAVCWKHSTTRPVDGTPQTCAGGQLQAGLCYPNCPAGSTGVGVVCYANCPAGWSDHGAGCTKPGTYSRGTHTLILDGPANCAREAEGRGCEQFGALLYPKPRPGYNCGPGGLVCSAACPAGWNDTGLTCVKPTVGRPVAGVPACASGLEYQAGLCYRPCAASYDGVGVVCWGKCDAAHPVDCGALCGRTQSECAVAILEMITSVLEVVANVVSTVGTAGATSGASAAAQSARASGKATIGNAVRRAGLSASNKVAIRATLLKLAKDAGKTLAQDTIEQTLKAASGEDFDWTILDPTGVAAAVQAYNKPICPTPALEALFKRNDYPSQGPGAVIKARDAETVYFVNRIGMRLPIANVQVFQACGFTWEMMKEQEPRMVNAYPTGPMLTTEEGCKRARNGRLPPGILIKTPQYPAATYFVDVSGQLRVFYNDEIRDGCGFSASSPAITIPYGLLVPAGGQLPSAIEKIDQCKQLRAQIK